MTGEELHQMSDASLDKAVEHVSVFARTTPEDKYRLVRALRNDGEIVAVTGDGINDALALKGADIGIAMGVRGTDAAKEAADIVLADDNYSTITQGIFDGRKFFDNLSKGVKYYLAVKVALIGVSCSRCWSTCPSRSRPSISSCWSCSWTSWLRRRSSWSRPSGLYTPARHATRNRTCST
jgi:magnesium-transporting ATPase (P-type)